MTFKKHAATIRREARALSRARGRTLQPVQPAGWDADADTGPDTIDPVMPRPLPDDLPAYQSRTHPTWYQVMRAIQRGPDRRNYGWECVGESPAERDAVVLASSQRYWCRVVKGSKQVFDNKREIKVVPGDAPAT